MSAKTQLTKKEASQQQVQRSSQHARDVETQEHSASANASVRRIVSLYHSLSLHYALAERADVSGHADIDVA